MIQSSLAIAKKTKQEILDEYEKLQGRLDELEVSLKTVTSDASRQIVGEARGTNVPSLERAFADFQTALSTQATQLRDKMLEQARTLQGLQEAVAISEEQLNAQHALAVTADAFVIMQEEQKKQTAAFEHEAEDKKRIFDELMLAKKKVWEREAEEYEYQKKVKYERDTLVTEEREKALAQREEIMRSQEQEINSIRKALEQQPKELERLLTQKESEVSARLMLDFAHEKALAEKEASGRIQMLELTVRNLEERLTVQIDEIRSLKERSDEANAKAQALAIKAIERPTTLVTQSVPVQAEKHN